jgi:cytochrome c biogenesis protein
MAEARTAPRPILPRFDPLLMLWRGLTSVRFALAIIAFLALAALIGVLVPQLPGEIRGNAAAEAAWYGIEHRHFGVVYETMRLLGIFTVFRSVWFVSGLAVLVGSVCVCTANRLPPVYRNVFQPQTRVPDDYYARDASVVSVAAPDAGALADALRRRRYKVTLEHDGNATYLFADRYPWAQFATFVSHLALILFLAGGLVTLVAAKQQFVFVAEGEAGASVFSLTDRDHMSVFVENTVGEFTSTGQPRDYRTYLVIFRNGTEIARGVTTVNRPLSAGGYRFHQTAYFPDGAALSVRDLTTGRVVYDEVVVLSSKAATPRIVVRDAAGAVILDDAIIPTDFIAGAAGTIISLPGREFWVGGRPPATEGGAWQLVVFETTASTVLSPGVPGGVLNEGEKIALGDLSLSFAGFMSIPSSTVRLPGSDADGVAELSSGPSGSTLTVGPVQGRALVLAEGNPAILGNYEYSFNGKREFAGITVRRDPGTNVIWLATGVFLLGLALTFYTPRRRLWGKITAGQAAFRGLGGRTLAIEKDIRGAAETAAAERI